MPFLKAGRIKKKTQESEVKPVPPALDPVSVEQVVPSVELSQESEPEENKIYADR